jgi:hypothetical protein
MFVGVFFLLLGNNNSQIRDKVTHALTSAQSAPRCACDEVLLLSSHTSR